MKSNYFLWRIDAGSYGVQETRAPSAAKALSNVVWRIKQRGVRPIMTYWSEPKLVIEENDVHT